MGYRLLLLWVVCCHLTAANRGVDVGVAGSQPTYTCLSRPTIVGDDSALGNELGHVTVVSLIQASSDYSRRQAALLNDLRLNMNRGSNNTRRVGLHVVGVNSRHWSASLMISELSTVVNFSVYQATHRNDVWSRLGGYKDDLFVYDRWGNLAHYVPFPYSYVPNRYVEAAILSAMNDGPCSELSTTVAPSVNCSNSTDGIKKNSVDDDYASSLTSGQRQSSEAASRQAVETGHRQSAGNRQHHQRRQHNRHHQRHQVPSSRCLCLPTTIPGGLRHCLCRSLSSSSSPAQANCFCAMTASQLDNQCSWQQADWSASTDVRACSCPVSSLQSSPSCSCQGPPSPYGQFSGLSESTVGYCRPHGQPVICPQAVWRWPLASASDSEATVRWSWQMELESGRQPSSGDGQNAASQPSAVRWMWPQLDGLPVAEATSDKTWRWREIAEAVGGSNSWKVRRWECGKAGNGSVNVSWVAGRPWRDADESIQHVECKWQGQRVDRVVWWPNIEWNDDVEWRRQQVGGQWDVQWRLPWGRWSPEQAWQSDWQLVEWSWDNGNAASDLWQQASNVSWSRRSWHTVPGWSWKDAPKLANGRRSRQRTTDNDWLTGNRDSWVTVKGWRWANNRLVFGRWQTDGDQQQVWRQGVLWSDTSVAEWAWGQRRGLTE